jgi:hypothetical protein
MDPNAKYKVPGRLVYCSSIRRWISAVVWIYVVSPLFRYHIESLLPHSDTQPQ